MSELNLLIIEDDKNTCDNYKSIIKTLPDINLIAVTADSREALNIFNAFNIDAIILDLELSAGSGNGVEFLFNIKNHPNKPYVLVTTYNSSSITYDIVRSYGADFILYKHSIGYTESSPLEYLYNIKDILLSHKKKQLPPTDYDNIIEKRLTNQIHNEFDAISLPHNLKGYQYLIEGIKLVYNESYHDIYKTIGKNFNKTPVVWNVLCKLQLIIFGHIQTQVYYQCITQHVFPNTNQLRQ